MKKYYLLYLLLVNLLNVAGQTSVEPVFNHELFTRFRNLTTRDGLSGNNVLDMVQDSCGFIWIATTNGLNRYDGYKFRTFLHDEEDSLSLSDNYVTSLSIDVSGCLWVGTKKGLNRYNPQNESFWHFPIHSQFVNGLSNGWVRKVYHAPNSGILWVETVDGVLNKIDLKTNDIRKFRHEKIGSRYYDYHSIFCDRSGNLWFGGRDFGPYKLDTITNQFSLIKADPNNPDKKRDNDIACIFQDSGGKYWMSATDGFYQYFPEDDRFRKWLATSTFDIVEAYNKKLWIATGHGLYSFNPETAVFTAYQHNENDNNNNTLVSNQLNCLLFDANYNLWIGTDKGISLLHYRENLFRHYLHIPATQGSLSSNKVSCFLQDSDNQLWIGTKGGGLLKWDTLNDSFIDYEKKFPGKMVSCLYEDREKDIWIGLWSGRGFYKFDRNAEKFTHYALRYNSLKFDWYNDFYEDNKNRLWVGFWGAQGVHFFNRDKGMFEPYNLNLLEAPMVPELKLIEIDNDFVWCFSQQGYLHRYNIKGDFYESFVNFNKAAILPEWGDNNHINILNLKHFEIVHCLFNYNQMTFFGTNNGLIIKQGQQFKQIIKPWLTDVFAFAPVGNEVFMATSSGLVKLNIRNFTFDWICHFDGIKDAENRKINRLMVTDSLVMMGTGQGLLIYNLNQQKWLGPDEISVTGSVNDILKTSRGVFWLATNQGLVKLDRKLKISGLYNTENSFHKGLLSQNIYSLCMPNEVLWLGTEKGLLKFSGNDSVFVSASGLVDIPVYSVKLHNKTLWLATGSGLTEFRPAVDSAVFRFKKSNHQLSSRLTQFIYPDNKGYVWMGTTNNGLNRITASSMSIQQFTSSPGNADAFWGNHASAILQCADNTLLIGGLGINIYNYKNGTFTHFTSADGLPSDVILGLVEDKQGSIWISTPKGLIQWNRKTNQLRVYAEGWGMIPGEFNEALFRTKSNEILVASDDGFYAFDPKSIGSVLSSDKVEITGFKIFNKTVRTDFTQNKRVVLKYDQNFFSFEFSDLNFLKTKTQYLYKLKGIDEDWVKTDNINFASYTHIDHGNYTFCVTTEANLKTGISPQKIELVIEPPFWKRTWFVFIEMLLVLCIISSIYYQRIKRFRLKEKQLKLEQKLLRSQMNPHFVFNALIAIQSFIFKSEPREAGRYLSKFAKLMRLFLQNTRNEYILLSKELETLAYYMELQKLRFNDSFDFSIDCTEDIDPEHIKIPPMMAQPFIENAIEHGFKAIKYPGMIEVNYSFIEDSILISIRDNGIGITKSMQQSEIKKHKSLATVIARERLNIFNKKSDNYSMQINDLSEVDRNITGTEVLINVPFKTEF